MSADLNPTETRLEVQKLNQLPAMSLVVHQFLQALEDDDVEVRQLAQIIEKDPALTARIIGLANAAYFGLTERVTSVEEAIFKVLGLNTAKSLALSIVLAGPFDARHCPGFKLSRYWAQAMCTAMLAQRLAPLVRAEPRPATAEAYLCGLLHDLGLLALVHIYPDEMAQVFATSAQPPKPPLSELEHEALGANHHQVGGWLARKWHLPGNVVTVIEQHVDGTYDGPGWASVALIGFCSKWAVRFLDGEQDQVSLAIPEALGMDAERAACVLEEMRVREEEVLTMAQILSGA